MNLWDTIVNSTSTWVPQAPPDLSQYHHIELDTETTGLKWFEKDRPIGIAIYYGDKTQYLPWGHNGGNLDESVVKGWAQRELRGKRITNLNTRFDIHMLREWGIDLEAQGCEVSDVGHYAALLDDHRKSFSLDNIAKDYLGVGKIEGLDKTRMASYHAGDVAAYAENDVKLVHQLKDKMWPLLDEQDLQQVRELEDKVIYVVCEMEKNGSPIDLELLEKWISQSQKQYESYIWELSREVGFQVNPDSPQDQKRIFEKLKIPLEFTTAGRPSFTDAILKRIEHPTIKLMRKAGKLSSLRSKFLTNTKKNLDSHGILRYALHQLRATRDETSENPVGTVTGRFSSSEITPSFGINIQQRSKPSKQRVSFGFNEKDSSHDDEIFLIRKLHIPQKGMWLSSDMRQVEYRLFASYANNPSVVDAYKENPLLSFHEFMHEKLRAFKEEITYGRTKDCNFAKVYGAGLGKLALMMGFITSAEFERLRKEKAKYNHPKYREAIEIEQLYNQVLPEVKGLLKEASHLAMPKCNEHCNLSDELHQRLSHRGYVKTLMGRRSRFPEGHRIHKALNSVIQGGGGDVLKQKCVELHENRKETGFLLRFCVHDEIDGDVPNKEAAQKVANILNSQSFPQIRIPLLWETGIGPNWAECEDV